MEALGWISTTSACPNSHRTYTDSAGLEEPRKYYVTNSLSVFLILRGWMDLCCTLNRTKLLCLCWHSLQFVTCTYSHHVPEILLPSRSSPTRATDQRLGRNAQGRPTWEQLQHVEDYCSSITRYSTLAVQKANCSAISQVLTVSMHGEAELAAWLVTDELVEGEDFIRKITHQNI